MHFKSYNASLEILKVAIEKGNICYKNMLDVKDGKYERGEYK